MAIRRITAFASIDLDALRPYLAPADMSRKANPPIRLYQQEQSSTFRRAHLFLYARKYPLTL